MQNAMDTLTPRQLAVWHYIRDYQAETGFPPSRAEIARHFAFRSINAVTGHLEALARKGAIELAPDIPRGIRLLGRDDDDAAPAGLPLIGEVAAGSPLLAEQNIQRHCPVDPALFRPRADYLLRVTGQSMRDAGILDGDWLAVHATREARSGQVVVARVGHEVTVKRLWREGGRLELRAEHPEFPNIVPDAETQQVAIEGIVVGLIRADVT